MWISITKPLIARIFSKLTTEVCLLLKDKVDGEYQESKSDQVIDPEVFSPEDNKGKYCEYSYRYDFLDYFKLN